MSGSESKAQILRASTKLFARRGFKGTSLQSIADAVGMKKPSLLYHYRSKDAIRQAVINDLLNRWRIRLPEILAATLKGKDRFSALFNEIIAFFKTDPNRALLIMREMTDRPTEIRDQLGGTIRPWLGLISQSITDGQDAGRVRPNVDPEAYLIQCLVLVIGSFAAADLAGIVFEDTDAESRVDRQIQEIVRMAHAALYIDNPKSQ